MSGGVIISTLDGRIIHTYSVFPTSLFDRCTNYEITTDIYLILLNFLTLSTWNLATNTNYCLKRLGFKNYLFTRYDSVTLAQMYSPWFSSMPGNNNPSNWNYENDKLDELTQKIYSGEFNKFWILCL